MSVRATFDLGVPENVLAEVQRKSAQVEFENFCEAMMRQFADLEDIQVSLVDDPDEEDRSWIVFKVSFSESVDFDYVQKRRLEFYRDLDNHNAPISQPICVLSNR